MLQLNLQTAKENVSTPLPFLVSKFSKNYNQTEYIPNSLNVTEQGNEFSTIPSFSNVKFQNLFFKNKISTEKKIIFSKLIVRSDTEMKEKDLRELPELIRSEHVSTNISEICKNNKINSNHMFTNLSEFSKNKKTNHSKNLSNPNISTKPLLKKDNFNTTLGYFKYLIEKNQNTTKLNTNFMVKDKFLIFSKKFNQKGKEITHPNNSHFENKKSYHKMLTDNKNNKSRRINPEYEFQNIQLEINPSKSKENFPYSFTKANTCNNNSLDFKYKNFKMDKVFKNDADDELISKKKLKQFLESNKKKSTSN